MSWTECNWIWHFFGPNWCSFCSGLKLTLILVSTHLSFRLHFTHTTAPSEQAARYNLSWPTASLAGVWQAFTIARLLVVEWQDVSEMLMWVYVKVERVWYVCISIWKGARRRFYVLDGYYTGSKRNESNFRRRVQRSSRSLATASSVRYI